MNEKRKLYYYLTPFLLAVLALTSNFMGTELFKFGELNFAVWFILSLFCFACGWLINTTLGWRFGGKIVFAIIVTSAIISVLLVLFLKDYFGSSELVTENLILYSLRVVVLGCMAFFGMAIRELITLQRELSAQRFRVDTFEQMITDAKKEADLELREAKFKAEKMIKDAEMQVKILAEKKGKIEKDIKEFILTEKELIRKYEEKD